MVNDLYESGVDLSSFTKELLAYLRRILITKAGLAVLANQEFSLPVPNIENQELLKMLDSFFKAQQEIKISPIPQLPLEIAIMELCE